MIYLYFMSLFFAHYVHNVCGESVRSALELV